MYLDLVFGPQPPVRGLSMVGEIGQKNVGPKRILVPKVLSKKIFVPKKGGLSGVEVEPELIAKHIGNSGWI